MSELTQPVSRQQAEASPIRLTVLMLASLIAPAVLFIQSLRGQYRDDSVIAVFSAILFLLVLSRLWDVAASHRRALGRERAVRLAGASLTSAVTVEEAARRGAGCRGRPHRPALAARRAAPVRDDGTFRVVRRPLPAIRPGPARPGNGPRPGCRSSPDRCRSSCRPRNSATQGQTLLAGEGGVLLCPLTLRDRPSGDPLIGVLAVFGEQRTLADLSVTFEILAIRSLWRSSASRSARK